MRFAARLVLAAVLTVAFAASADAQNRQRQGQGRQGGGMFGGGTPSVYSVIVTFNMDGEGTVNPVLKDELKIKDDQKDKLVSAMKPISEKRRELRGGGGQGGQQLTEEQRKEMAEKRAKLDEDAKKAVEGVLTADQVKRLTQINYQVMGVNAFTNKEVETALKLTDDQKEKIKTIVDDYNKDRREIMMAGFQRGQQQNREEAQKRMEENQKKVAALTKDADEKVSTKLTDEQKKSWKDMQGDKFDVSKLLQRPMQRRDN
jgi:hypothetical protein